MAKVVAERFASPFGMMEVWWIGGKFRDQFPFGERNLPEMPETFHFRN